MPVFRINQENTCEAHIYLKNCMIVKHLLRAAEQDAGYPSRNKFRSGSSTAFLVAWYRIGSEIAVTGSLQQM
jgi:hypothetical protein